MRLKNRNKRIFHCMFSHSSFIAFNIISSLWVLLLILPIERSLWNFKSFALHKRNSPSKHFIPSTIPKPKNYTRCKQKHSHTHTHIYIITFILIHSNSEKKCTERGRKSTVCLRLYIVVSFAKHALAPSVLSWSNASTEYNNNNNKNRKQCAHCV